MAAQNSARTWTSRLVMVFVALLVAGCAATSVETPEPIGPVSSTSSAPAAPSQTRTSAFLDKFNGGPSYRIWQLSNWDPGRGVMDVEWRRSAISDRNGSMEIELAYDRDAESFVSGEVQTRSLYGYGEYEAVMQVTRGEGFTTNFFLYSAGKNGVGHEEIAISIRGGDPTTAYLKYHTGGEQGPVVAHPLGFDASEGLHLYAIDWTQDALRFVIDGEVVAERSLADLAPPSTPSKLHFNTFAGAVSAYDWLGVPDLEARGTAILSCVSYRPWGSSKRKCSDADSPTPIAEAVQFAKGVGDGA